MTRESSVGFQFARDITRTVTPIGATTNNRAGYLHATPERALTRIKAGLREVRERHPAAGCDFDRVGAGEPFERVRDSEAYLEWRAAEVERLGQRGEPRWTRYAYMRYAGQGFEVQVETGGHRDA